MLAAVHATEERLIAPRYMMQISANLVFSYTKRELFASQSTRHHKVDASQSESDMQLFSFVHKNATTARCSLRDDFNGNVIVFNVYKRYHSDVIVKKTYSSYSELNSLKDVYFGFSIFGKLTE